MMMFETVWEYSVFNAGQPPILHRQPWLQASGETNLHMFSEAPKAETHP